MEKKKNIKKTIGFTPQTYNLIKEYCGQNGTKIGWFTEKILLDYIKRKIDEK